MDDCMYVSPLPSNTLSRRTKGSGAENPVREVNVKISLSEECSSKIVKGSPAEEGRSAAEL